MNKKGVNFLSPKTTALPILVHDGWSDDATREKITKRQQKYLKLYWSDAAFPDVSSPLQFEQQTFEEQRSGLSRPFSTTPAQVKFSFNPLTPDVAKGSLPLSKCINFLRFSDAPKHRGVKLWPPRADWMISKNSSKLAAVGFPSSGGVQENAPKSWNSLTCDLAWVNPTLNSKTLWSIRIVIGGGF